MGKRSKDAKGVETIEATTDNTSTGAVEFPAEPVTLEASHIGADPVVTRSVGGPVTMTVSWASEAQAKVVTPAEGDGSPQTSATAETK